VSTECGDENEKLVVKKKETETNIGEKVTIKDVASIEGLLSGGSGGMVDLSLWNNKTACEAKTNKERDEEKEATGINPVNRIFDSGQITLSTENGHKVANTSTSVGDGTFYWRVSYSGDEVNEPSESKCTESASVSGNTLPTGVDP
jgi:hypothetical protein